MIQKTNKNDTSLDYAVFGFYLDISSSARKKAQVRLDALIESFDKIVSKFNNLKSTFKGGQIKEIEKVGQWCIGAYIIESSL